MRRTLVAFAGAIALTLTACGSSSASGPEGALAGKDLVLAASQSTTASSAKVDTTVSLDGGDNPSTWTVDGSFDLAKRLGSFDLTIPPVRGFDLGKLPGRFVDDTIYVQTPPNVKRAVGGKQWTKVDATTLSTLSGKQVNAIEQPMTDPSRSLRLLQDITNATKVGTNVLHGDNTTHYRVEVDLNAAAAKANDEQKDHLSKLAALYAGKPLLVDVWVDAQSRVRKVHYEVTSSQLDLGAVTTTTAPVSGGLELTAEFYDFGTSVDVQAPAAGDVMDATSLSGLFTSLKPSFG